MISVLTKSQYKCHDERVGKEINGVLILENLGLRQCGKQKQTFYNCKCKCGNEFEAKATRIMEGTTRSCGCARKRVYKNSALGHLYAVYKSNSDKRSYSFNIPFDVFEKMTSSNCHYCGKEPSILKNSASDSYVYNGIDRVDNKIGYELGNIVSCCVTCNRAKNNMSYDEYIDYLDRLVKFRGGLS